MELSFLEMSSIEDYQGFGGMNAKISNVGQVDKRTAVGYPDRGLVQHRVLCKRGMTVYQSAAYPGFKLKHMPDGFKYAGERKSFNGLNIHKIPTCSNTQSL